MIICTRDVILMFLSMSRRIADYRKPYFGFKETLFEELASKLYYRPLRQDFPVYGEDTFYELEILSAISIAINDRITYINRCQEFKRLSVLPFEK